jgi:transcriptional regulator with PAS, ATPase and Fis domain
MVLTLSASDVSVLITGDSGVGKEVLARNLHRFSTRGEHPFVPVNCAALSPGILESELFGHSRGAFTGAIQSRAGFFELAHNGTLFLDEIAEIPLHLQAKLLRVLQEREVRRMGEGSARRVNVRLLSATNRDISKMVEQGGFRKDLFYRINVVEIGIQPLKERPEDVEDLIRYFYRRRALTEPDLTEETRKLLCRYTWPGNIRELQNEFERMIALYGVTPRITPDMFSDRLTEEVGGTELDVKIFYDAPLSRAVGYLEENLLKKTLIQTNWNKTQTARRLGLSRQGLLKKIKRYGIQREAFGVPLKETTG